MPDHPSVGQSVVWSIRPSVVWLVCRMITSSFISLLKMTVYTALFFNHFKFKFDLYEFRIFRLLCPPENGFEERLFFSFLLILLPMSFRFYSFHFAASIRAYLWSMQLCSFPSSNSNPCSHFSSLLRASTQFCFRLATAHPFCRLRNILSC